MLGRPPLAGFWRIRTQSQYKVAKYTLNREQRAQAEHELACRVRSRDLDHQTRRENLEAWLNVQAARLRIKTAEVRNEHRSTTIQRLKRLLLQGASARQQAALAYNASSARPELEDAVRNIRQMKDALRQYGDDELLNHLISREQSWIQDHLKKADIELPSEMLARILERAIEPDDWVEDRAVVLARAGAVSQEMRAQSRHVLLWTDKEVSQRMTSESLRRLPTAKNLLVNLHRAPHVVVALGAAPAAELLDQLGRASAADLKETRTLQLSADYYALSSWWRQSCRYTSADRLRTALANIHRHGPASLNSRCKLRIATFDFDPTFSRASALGEQVGNALTEAKELRSLNLVRLQDGDRFIAGFAPKLPQAGPQFESLHVSRSIIRNVAPLVDAIRKDGTALLDLEMSGCGLSPEMMLSLVEAAARPGSRMRSIDVGDNASQLSPEQSERIRELRVQNPQLRISYQ